MTQRRPGRVAKQPICKIEGCERKHMSRGWCSLHYNRWICHRDPLHITDTSRPVLDRFMEKVKVNTDTGCWEWQGHIGPQGYGHFRSVDAKGPAHRRGWELLRGPVPDYLQLDHLCRVRHCVNPDHLEPVSQAVNMQRAWASRETCKRGHSTIGNGRCQECRNLRARERRAALKCTVPPSL